MTTEVTEGMPQKAGVLQGDDIADMWWDGQYGRRTYDNHIVNTKFIDLMEAAPEDTYFPCDIVTKGARYKWRNKPSSDPSKWEDSKVIYENVPKSQSAQKLVGSIPVKAPIGPTAEMARMSGGITKEIKVWKLTVGSGDRIETVNEMLADEEWTLFSAVPMEENNKTVMFVFVR